MNKSINLINNKILDLSDEQVIMLALGENNPGAYTVIDKLFDLIDNDETKNNKINDLIKELIHKKITGVRLWYIYKNEAKLNINNLLNINLEPFTDKYFYEKLKNI